MCVDVKVMEFSFVPRFPATSDFLKACLSSASIQEARHAWRQWVLVTHPDKELDPVTRQSKEEDFKLGDDFFKRFCDARKTGVLEEHDSATTYPEWEIETEYYTAEMILLRDSI